MNEKIDAFVEEKNSRYVCNLFENLKDLGCDDNFLDIYKDSTELEQIIVNLNPTSEKSITTICSLIGSYAKFIGNRDAHKEILKVSKNRTQIWEKIKPNAPQKYISYETYINVLQEISFFDEYNYLYYQTLFSAIYEGIFCEDMSVLTNLTSSDIDGNIVTLHVSNGYSYKMALSSDLVNNLKNVAEEFVWYRKNRYSMCEIKISGKYPNSCFKKEYRKNGSDDYDLFKSVYYNKLRTIMKNCLGYYISPSQLFVSGIMHRICLELKDKNITIRDAFSLNNRDNIVSNTIKKELSRCEYDTPVKSFRELLKGHLEVFDNI